ncbi:YibE/F family protein [Fusibacter paucivorans]|uniref:YibE/F family protein n=1 Tax=Fusibacter paucivorans TaxID=76009 RepID=A0ABS5PM64_9FIRM|nr:YibE/F family protein [Fusibacter paucivorans]MBS7526243.1 YibE/F family protein [Fusibacter paucivorans]
MIRAQYHIAVPTIITLILCIMLWLLPSQYTQKIFPNTERVPVSILTVDNDSVHQIGLVKQGEQNCSVEVLGGQYKGQTAPAVNLMLGSLEQDKLYVPGDKALAVIDYTDDGIHYINLVDHYRLTKTIVLVAAFIILLIAFAGWTGFRSIISFMMTVLVIWKILVPAFLNGFNPILIGLGCTLALTSLIILLVYGLDTRSLSAILGSSLGTLLTAFIAMYLVGAFNIHGAVMPYAESLMYAGYAYLDLTQIFIASIFIASSGAMMDVSVDITSAMHELIISAPDLSRRKLIQSGFAIGRAIMGTMTTTLLLAYSGGFISLLMVFMAQGTPLINILNLKYISSEILHTVIGSIGLVTVAPFTALTSGFLLAHPDKHDHHNADKRSNDHFEENANKAALETITINSEIHFAKTPPFTQQMPTPLAAPNPPRSYHIKTGRLL